MSVCGRPFGCKRFSERPSLTVAPYLSADLPASLTPLADGYIAAADALYDPPRAISAQTILATSLASATVTSMRGFRASVPASQGLARDVSPAAVVGAELAQQQRPNRQPLG